MSFAVAERSAGLAPADGPLRTVDAVKIKGMEKAMAQEELDTSAGERVWP